MMQAEDQPVDGVGIEGDQRPEAARSGGGVFEIRVKGQLNSQWADWLGDLDVTLLDNGEMLLSGTIVDQAALLGLLNKLNRLNLSIVSVTEINQKKTKFTGDTNEQHSTVKS